MANEQDFAKELNALITRYLNMECDPQDIVEELARETNSIFGHYNLEIYLEATLMSRNKPKSYGCALS